MDIWDETDDGDLDDEERPPERSAADITEAEKYEFLHLTRQGLNRQEAANQLGYKARHWRAITSPKSMFYDEEFARDYGEVIGSPEFQHNFLERLRESATRRALMGSDRLLEKLLMIHDPEWKVLREKTTEVNINFRALIETHLKALPTDKLEQILRLVEEGNTIDGEASEVFELPRSSAA